MTSLTRILQSRMIPIEKSGEQNYSTGFPSKRAEGQALCAPGPTGCIPPEGRPLYGRKTSPEVFRLIREKDSGLPELRVIGVLESCFQEKFGTPRQPCFVPGSTARLRIYPQYFPEHSLAGLAEFSHVWLISWFHLNTNKTFHPKIHPPRLRGGKIGVFASRSPHRPNPLALSLAKLELVKGDTLHLSGIDLINGTPVLDIKPYLPFSDSAKDPLSGWVPGNDFPELKVKFSARALKDIGLKRLSDGPDLRGLIAGTLRNDPRNMRDATQMKDGAELEFFLCDREVHFTVTGDTATVSRVENASKFEKKFRREKPQSGA